ncbi:MAG TPA: outer membrane beta-barrel protein [Bryobacteraceae bacterium]
MTVQIARFGSVIACAFALTGIAKAADLRVAPLAPPPLFNWSGCYVGGYLGGAWLDGDPTFTDLGNSAFRSYSGGLVAGRLENSHSWNVGLGNSSFIGGGTLGCNWQPVGSPFVIGIEGEAGYMKSEGSAFDPLRSPTLQAISPDVLGRAKIGDWYGMITGRLGYAWDRTLVYVKGGAAFVQVTASVTDNCLTVATGCGNWVTLSRETSDTITTWTAGGGIEWALSNNWSVKGEYMFIGLDNHSLTTCGFAATATAAQVAGGQFCFNHQFPGIHTAKVGLNYRFGSLWR